MAEPDVVVLVEGASDAAALEALAVRLGRDLAAELIAIVPVGGAHAVAGHLARLEPRRPGLEVRGLCDAGEQEVFRHAFEEAGLARRDFFVCVADLEDELIRALGAESVERVLEAENELRAFRKLQRQHAWRDQGIEEQLRRFMGSVATRKVRYARRLVEAVDLERVPRPLARVLAAVPGQRGR